MARFCGACGGHFAMTIEGIAALSAVAGMAKGIQVGAALVAQHPRACMCMCVCVCSGMGRCLSLNVCVHLYFQV